MYANGGVQSAGGVYSMEHGALAPPPRTRLPINTVQKAVPTDVTSPSRFFVHLKAEEATLTNMCVGMHRRYEQPHGAPPRLNSVAKGQYVASRYPVDNLWYRAEVTDLQPDVGALVRYIDYGNVEAANLDTLRPLTDEFCRTPPLAVECGIYDQGGRVKWSKLEVDRFKELLSLQDASGQAMVTIRVMGFGSGVYPNLHEVDVTFADGRSVRDFLAALPPIAEVASRSMLPAGLQIHGARFSAPSTGQQQPMSRVSLPQQFTPPSPPSFSTVSSYQPLPLEKLVGHTLSGIISQVTSPQDFFVRIHGLTGHNTDLRSVAEKIHTSSQQYCNEKMMEPRSGMQKVSPKKNDCCFAMFDNQWYRAQVISEDDTVSQFVKVRYIDYGNEELVPKDAVVPMEEQFARAYPALAFRCTLQGAEPPSGGSWPKAAIDVLLALAAEERELKIGLKSVGDHTGRCHVTLVNPASPEQLPMDILCQLRSRHLALAPIPPRAPVTPSEPISFKYKSLTLPAGATAHRVAVVKFSNVDCLHVQTELHLNALRAVTDICAQRYKGASRPPMLPRPAVVGSACVALYEEDEEWYRASVVKDTGGDTIEVEFVDFGNRCVCSSQNVRIPVADPAFRNAPGMAVQCALYGVVPKQRELSPDTVDRIMGRLGDETNGVSVFMVVSMDATTSIHQVQLTMKDGQSFSDIMVQEGLATPIGGTRPLAMPSNDLAAADLGLTDGVSLVRVVGLPDLEIPAVVNDYLDVIISSVVDSANLYVVPADQERNLEVLRAEMNHTYSMVFGQEMNLVNPSKGEICAVKMDNGNFERAVVISRDARNIEVALLDVGGVRSVSKDSLKRLAKSTQNTPPMAVPIALADLGTAVPMTTIKGRLENARGTMRIRGSGEGGKMLVQLYLDCSPDVSISDVIKGKATLPPLSRAAM